MRRLVLATLATLMLGSALMAQPAEARCWWNGWVWVCNRAGPGPWAWHSRWCFFHPFRCW